MFRSVYSVFKVRLVQLFALSGIAILASPVSRFGGGGLKWNRTIDLALIRRAL